MKTIRSYLVTFGLVRSACLVLAVSWCVMAVPSSALGKRPSGKVSGKKQEINVTVMFRDRTNDPNGALDDRIQSDGRGPYSRDRKNKGKIFIGLGGQLRMELAINRSLYLDFTGAPSVGCRPFFVGESGGMHTGKADENGDGKLTSEEGTWDLTLMTPGSSMRIGLGIMFAFNGVGWVLQFGDQYGLTDLVTVVGGPDLNQDGFSDSWVIEAGSLDTAALYMLESAMPQDIPCNFVCMPFAALVVKD